MMMGPDFGTLHAERVATSLKKSSTRSDSSHNTESYIHGTISFPLFFAMTASSTGCSQASLQIAEVWRTVSSLDLHM